MHAETFLREFAPLASGPGGIQKLRKLVLQLAVRGKLVPQMQAEGDAGDLLYQLQDRLKKEIKNTKYVETAPLFRTPSSWRWTTMAGIGRIVGGGTPKSNEQAYYSDAGIPWLTPADLYGFSGKFIERGKRGISERGLAESSARLIPAGSVLFSSRAPIGYSAIAANPMATNQGFKSCVPYIEGMSEFILIYLRASVSEFESRASGTTFKEVSGKVVSAVPIPIPPLPEQKRIAAKVDELMSLCDRLEAQQLNGTKLKRTAAVSALHCLSGVGTKTKDRAGLSFIITNFKNYFDDTKNIESLRSAILDLAHSGAFCDEKPKLIELQEVLSFGPRNGYSPKPAPHETSTRSISLSAVTKGTFDRTKYKYINEDFDENSHLWLQPDDILIQRANSLDYVGMSAIYDGLPREFIYPDLIMKIRVSAQMMPEYVVCCLQSPSVRRYFQDNATGTSGSMPKINQAVVKGTPIPFVTRKAQKATIEAVRVLMDLCDQLDEQVREGERLNASLMNSLIHALTETDPDGGGTAGKPNENANVALLGAISNTEKDGAGEQSGSKSASAARTSETGNFSPAVSASEVDTKFKEAVLVGAIVKAFFDTGGEPIGNFRLQKAVYFARRHNGEHVGQMEYLKKAAGPYNPSMKYSGGIAIAKQKSWLREMRGRFGFGHVPGPAAEEMENWFAKYGFEDPARWVAEHFRFKRNEEWETLATVDYAMEHLQSLGVEADATRVLQYIRADDEWHPKIEKLRLTEMSVGTAMLEVKALFSAEGGDDSV